MGKQKLAAYTSATIDHKCRPSTVIHLLHQVDISVKRWSENTEHYTQKAIRVC